MSDDPIFRLALQRAVQDSADVEAQLSIVSGCRPVVAILLKARAEAAEAGVALSTADAEDPKLIRTLQNLIIRFDDLVRWLREIVQSGFDADQEISSDDREELTNLLSPHSPEGEQVTQFGLADGVPRDA